MPQQFQYKALDGSGKPFTGLVSAENTEQVLDFLADKSLTPVKIAQKKENTFLLSSGLFRGIDYESLIIFTNQLSTMYRAGVPILRAMSIIKIGVGNNHFNRALIQIRNSIESGVSLSQAMAEYTDLFPAVYINSIAAGEESGKLEDILEEQSYLLEKEMEINRQIKSGLRYPIIVLVVISLAVVVLMSYVIPKFMAFYSSFGAELPLPTRMLIGMSNFFTTYWYIIGMFLFFVLAGFKKVMNNPKGKLFVDRHILKIPIFGDLIIKGNVARFALMFRILFKAGLPLIQSLNILAHSVKNSMISLEIKKLEELFRRGSEGNIVEEQFQFLPDLAKQMIAIGMESGSLEQMLGELGNHYTKEVEYTSRQLTSILEPILTLVISVFVLIMALAIFLPMWNLIKVFNG